MFKRHQKLFFIIAVLIGILIRFIFIFRGHNFDFDSFCIVGELVSQGKNVYANTPRYNYGPIFFTLLGMFYKLASYFTHKIILYRFMIVGTLTLADLGITEYIRRKAGIFWAILFFINPISLIITGYHNQFDNIAVLFALYGCYCIENTSHENNFKIQDLAGIILLSLSIITKHILFIMPVWILLNQNINPRKKILYAFVPPILFLLSFVPYCFEGWRGIIRHVFLYRSFNNFPLFGVGMIKHFSKFPSFSLFPLFTLFMCVGAYLFRREKIDKLILIYLTCLVCFSSAVANQYLAIPCATIVILFKLKSLIYFFVGGFYLILDGAGLHLANFLGIRISSNLFYTLLTWCLLYYLIIYTKNKFLN